LEVQDTLYSQHDAWWDRLSVLETTCETAKEEEATYPDVAEAMWKSLACGVDNNSNYYGRVIKPTLKKLKRAAIKLNADFAKKFTAKEASRLAAGTADIEKGVDKWSEADAEATFGECSPPTTAATQDMGSSSTPTTTFYPACASWRQGPNSSRRSSLDWSSLT
jgi:hypothetical protein